MVPGALGNKRGYDKPWQNNNIKKTGANGAPAPGAATGEKGTYLYHVYPEGTGPDENLITMLERDVVDKNPNVSFDDIAELDNAK